MFELQPMFPGSQPDSSNIVGRDRDITRLWNCILASSCLLNEPRRIGKSSVLVRMVAGMKPPQWDFLKSSVQGVSLTEEFVALVLTDIGKHRSLTDRVKQGARSFLEDVEADVGVGSTVVRLRGAFRQTPLQALEAALGAVSQRLESDGTYLAIAWDEFPDAVVSIIDNEGVQAAAALVGTLRRFREEFPDRLRWLLTGSVGLHHALRRLGSSGEKFVTDLQVVPLGPLAEDWARYLGGCLLLGAACRFDDATLTAMARETDGIPYLLHLLAIRARDHGPAEVTSADVPALFDRAISDLDVSQQSTHLLTRLGDYYDPDTAAAETLLDHVAAASLTRDEVVTATGLDEQLVRKLLGLLDRDHYLAADENGRYAWRYDSLRRIWVQRRSL